MRSLSTYIFLCIILILSSLYIYIKSVIDSIDFNINLDSVDLSNLNNKSISGGNAYVSLKLGFIIKFLGLFNISLSNLNIKAYYKNKLLANSSINEKNKEKIKLISNYNNIIYHDFDIQVNPNTIDLIYLITNKKQYLIDYYLSFKIIGLTINYSGIYTNK